MHLAVGDHLGDGDLPVGEATRGGYLTERGRAATFGHHGSRHLHLGLHLGRRESEEREPWSEALGGDGAGTHAATSSTSSESGSKAHEGRPVEALAADDVDDGRGVTVEVEKRRAIAEAVGRTGAAEGRRSAVRSWVETATGSPFLNPALPSAGAWQAEEAARAEAEAIARQSHQASIRHPNPTYQNNQPDPYISIAGPTPTTG